MRATPLFVDADCVESESCSVEELNDLLAALRTGFGPVGRTSAQNITARQMRIAQDLWQLVSPDNERRLRQICEDVTEIGADQARGNMMRIRRRVGLFASGDLYVALTETLNALDVQGGMNRLRAGDRDLWNQPALAELFDLAVSPQYAVARWRILR